jgi:hypothetical protein
MAPDWVGGGIGLAWPWWCFRDGGMDGDEDDDDDNDDKEDMSV